MRLLDRLITLIAGAAGTAGAVWLGARLANGSSWLTRGMEAFGLPILLVCGIAAIAAGLRRRWLGLTFALPGALALLAIDGVLWIPRAPTPNPARPSLTLRTQNLGGPTGTGVQPFVTLARDSGADVIAMQEYTEHAAIVYRANGTTDYPHSAIVYQRNIAGLGQGVISLLPIVEWDSWRATDRENLRARLAFAGTTITIYSVHLPQALAPGGGEAHAAALRVLLDRLVRETEPTIVVGDFNMTPTSAGYGQMAAWGADSWREVGFGFGATFPRWHEVRGARFLPTWMRLDYVWHSPHWRAIAARVEADDGGSDHAALTVTLELVEEGVSRHSS